MIECGGGAPLTRAWCQTAAAAAAAAAAPVLCVSEDRPLVPDDALRGPDAAARRVAQYIFVYLVRQLLVVGFGFGG